MTQIILPTIDMFEYFTITSVMPPIPVAMVKLPATLSDVFDDELDEVQLTEEGGVLTWYLTERRDELDDNGENAASRYELRGSVIVPVTATPEDKPEDIIAELYRRLEENFRKDGYVYFPKALRDGRHEDRYILAPIEEKIFTTRTERGMFEEVAWSPFGSIDEATKQEAQNLERNPLMRNWI
jgi:hypothetical protein